MKNRRRKIKIIDPKKIEFIGKQYMEKPNLQLFVYNKTDYSEIKDVDIHQQIDFEDPDKVYWLNLHGIHDVTVVQNICERLQIHRLVAQDILDTTQRPKLQEFDEYLFFSVKSILPQSEDSLEIEQISFLLGKNFVVSFQEKVGDHFEHIRQRIREFKGVARERSADFLLYLLLEAIIDNAVGTIDAFEKRISKSFKTYESIEASPDIIHEIEEYKEILFQIKKIIVPLKESISLLEKGIVDFVQEKHQKYFFDIKDLCIQSLENIDALTQKLESGINLFFSYQGHRMNQVMKTLTVVAAIFIPLTFIAGIYGMNFENMPELSWKWGYFGVWGIILALTIGMVIYFKRNKWF